MSTQYSLVIWGFVIRRISSERNSANNEGNLYISFKFFFLPFRINVRVGGGVGGLVLADPDRVQGGAANVLTSVETFGRSFWKKCMIICYVKHILLALLRKKRIWLLII
jgi:hypothetical protein